MKFILFVAVLFIPLSPLNAMAISPDCGKESRIGNSFSAEILSIQPTQFSVGMIEVNEKQSNFEKMGKSELKKYLEKHPAPVVRGPGQKLYMTDRHHLALALVRAGIEEMNIEIQDDLSGLSPANFWAEMKNKNYVYLLDENGRGPLSPQDLPEDVRGLKDDIFRSFAWYVQKKTAAFEKTDVLWAFFLWANFFRARIEKSTLENDFEGSLKLGAELARSPEAKGLPGFLGSSAP